MTDGLIWKKQSKDVDACVRKVEGQLLCDVWKEKIRRIRGRWFTSPWQSYSLVTSPPKRPATAAWRRRRPWCSQSICHTGPTKLRKKKMLLPFPAPASILTAFIYPHPLLFSISYVITAAASPPPITRLFLSPLPITLLLFYIHPYDSVLLIPWTVSPFPSSKFAFFLWSLNPLLILFALLSTPWSDLPSSPPHLCCSRPHSFPLAESPLISIRLPSGERGGS